MPLREINRERPAPSWRDLARLLDLLLDLAASETNPINRQVMAGMVALLRNARGGGKGFADAARALLVQLQPDYRLIVASVLFSYWLTWHDRADFDPTDPDTGA